MNRTVYNFTIQIQLIKHVLSVNASDYHMITVFVHPKCVNSDGNYLKNKCKHDKDPYVLQRKHIPQ